MMNMKKVHLSLNSSEVDGFSTTAFFRRATSIFFYRLTIPYDLSHFREAVLLYLLRSCFCVKRFSPLTQLFLETGGLYHSQYIIRLLITVAPFSEVCLENSCDTNATCIPDPSSDIGYTCRCQSGYTGNGFNCSKKGNYILFISFLYNSNTTFYIISELCLNYYLVLKRYTLNISRWIIPLCRKSATGLLVEENKVRFTMEN